GDHLVHAVSFKDAVPCKCVQVHSSHLPGSLSSYGGPLIGAQVERRQHLERNIRHILSGSSLEPLEIAHDLRQRLGVVPLSDQITQQGFSSLQTWPRVDHLDEVSYRWALAH